MHKHMPILNCGVGLFTNNISKLRSEGSSRSLLYTLSALCAAANFSETQLCAHTCKTHCMVASYCKRPVMTAVIMSSVCPGITSSLQS